MRKPFFVSYGSVGRRTAGGNLESFIPASFTTSTYNGTGLSTLEEAKKIFDEEAPIVNTDVDYDEFLPICIEVQYIPDVNGHTCYVDNVDYIIYDGENWYVPLKDNAVRKASEEEATEWVLQYLKAIESYEARVNAAPPATLMDAMFGGDEAAYPTKEEMLSMPKRAKSE